MILESFVWAAPGLVQLGHFDLVEQLRHYVKKHSEDHKDSHANSASSRLAVFVIASRCMTGRTNDALSALEELHRSANSEGADGADVVAYSFSVRNVVRVLLQNNRLEEADRVATESIRLAARFGKFSEIAIGMLECAVDLGLAYADRGMLSEANEVVLKLEALRQKMSETRELNFKIANVLLAIIRSYMQSNKLSPALTNAQRLRDLQSLAPDDYRIAGANVITCGNLAIVLAANGRIDDSISMLRRMFELCGGAVFAQNLEIGAQARNVLKDTSQQLLFVLDRSGNRVDLDRVRKMIRELSYRHSIALH
jgi:tetratricopeptide (TPR) repeat protein